MLDPRWERISLLTGNAPSGIGETRTDKQIQNRLFKPHSGTGIIQSSGNDMCRAPEKGL